MSVFPGYRSYWKILLSCDPILGISDLDCDISLLVLSRIVCRPIGRKPEDGASPRVYRVDVAVVDRRWRAIQRRNTDDAGHILIGEEPHRPAFDMIEHLAIRQGDVAVSGPPARGAGAAAPANVL